MTGAAARFALLVLALAPVSGREATGGQAREPVSFARDIAPAVGRHCTTCHRHDGAAPFSLTTAAAVRSHAATLALVVRNRVMPPWKPEPGFGEFRDTRRLPDRVVEQLTRWVEEGAPLDVPPDTAVASPGPSAMIPAPDLVLRLPAFALSADGPDAFRNFVVPVPTTTRRFVRGVSFSPRGQAVHHANLRIDPTRASRQLDEANTEAGYEGLILRSADFPDGHFLGWTPGQIGPVLSDDLAWTLEAGSDLVVQLHLRPTGRAETVAPAVGLYFTDRAPPRRPVMLRLGRQTLAIPAGATTYKVEDSFVLPVEADLYAVQPHAHFRAREVHAWATRPDGSREALLRIADWDARWQEHYRYRTPVGLPAGTRIDVTYVFDNSAANPRNPARPPVVGEWGWRTIDEMGDVWFQLLTVIDGDRARLQSEARRRMQSEDVLGCELLLRREPDHVALRNDAAILYMTLGRPADALRHFEAVTRLEPSSAAARFNEGVALEALGRAAEAAARYAEAIDRRPGYSAALNNLGALRLRQGRVADARGWLDQAVAADPQNVDARANLGLVLLDAGDADRALGQVNEALLIDPALVARLTPFAWLLATHPSPDARRPTQARALALRIVAATGGRDPAALDALAAAHAANGEFDAAVRVATQALALAEGDVRDGLAARLALYRDGRVYVMSR